MSLRFIPQFLEELKYSAELLLKTKLSLLLILGPIAFVGDYTEVLGEAACFTMAGIALIPCAERLSFVTEQVAAQTNGTIGALLNATFGNAPELLISTAALRSGFYRVVQLTLIGSMLTNLLFVFGLSCLAGGLRWHVQRLRMTSGNVSVGMLLLSTTGLLLPAALKLCGETGEHNTNDLELTLTDLDFSRVNAFIMMVIYILYLIFQLGTHIDEFDDLNDENNNNGTVFHAQHLPTKKNLFCLRLLPKILRPEEETTSTTHTTTSSSENPFGDVELNKVTPLQPLKKEKKFTFDHAAMNGAGKLHEVLDCNDAVPPPAAAAAAAASGAASDSSPLSEADFVWDDCILEEEEQEQLGADGDDEDDNFSQKLSSSLPDLGAAKRRRERRKSTTPKGKKRAVAPGDFVEGQALIPPRPRFTKEHLSDRNINVENNDEEEMSLRAGIFWLLIITMCVSSLSDIIVDTIDGFAHQWHMSELFTSVVIVPFFSNIAEQVSAILFASRNHMDLCVGVTVGSAIQVALFVAPSCVLIGWCVDRSMTLYLRGYETCCVIVGVLCVAAVLQGGTTNWLVGVTLLGVYFMIAAGFWFHELEDLSVDFEEQLHNNSTLTTRI